jgi:hypothetical protein
MDYKKFAGQMYTDAYQSIKKGEFMEKVLAEHIPAVLDYDGNLGQQLWQERIMPSDGKVVTLDTFEEYLLKQPRVGLGVPSFKWLKSVLSAYEDKAKRDKAFAALRQAIPDFDAKANEQALESAPCLRPTGRPKKGLEKGKEHLPLGSKGPTVDRLAARIKRDHPEIADKVRSGEIKSFHAAAIAAGIKKRTKAVPVDDPSNAIRSLMRVWTWDEINTALQEAKGGE